jgi:hypothetical protein
MHFSASDSHGPMMPQTEEERLPMGIWALGLGLCTLCFVLCALGLLVWWELQKPTPKTEDQKPSTKYKAPRTKNQDRRPKTKDQTAAGCYNPASASQ